LGNFCTAGQALVQTGRLHKDGHPSGNFCTFGRFAFLSDFKAAAKKFRQPLDSHKISFKYGLDGI
jgi:hypothetical protein